MLSGWPNRKTPEKPRGGGRSVRTAIGTQLRVFYNEIKEQPLPPRLIELLKKLDAGGG
jgi:hypothetical protein